MSARVWVNSRKCDINACSIKQEYIIPVDTKRPTYASQCKGLTAAKIEYPALKIPQSQILQQVLKNLETAFLSMWEHGFGFPRFKRFGQMRSFVFPQMSNTDLVGDYIDLPKIGQVKMIVSRPIPDGFDLRQTRIVRRASGYFVMNSLQCDVQVPDVVPHGHAIGIDLGLNTFAATSDGELIARPRFFVGLQSELKLLRQKAVWLCLPLYCRAT